MSLNRRNPRRDANEKAIVAALEAVGCDVTRVSGKGAPDLLIRRGWRPGTLRHTLLAPQLWAVEVKSGKGTRTDAQEVSQWPIVRSVDDALAVVGIVAGGRAPEQKVHKEGQARRDKQATSVVQPPQRATGVHRADRQ